MLRRGVQTASAGFRSPCTALGSWQTTFSTHEADVPAVPESQAATVGSRLQRPPIKHKRRSSVSLGSLARDVRA